MKIWVLDSNLFFKLVEGSDPAMRPALDRLAIDAAGEGAIFAISAVTAQEFLTRPRTIGEGEWHKARRSLDHFEVLTFDRAAAEAAAELEIKRNPQYYAANASRTEAKKHWFRDAAIVGTALSKGAQCVCTHDGPMANMIVQGMMIKLIR